MPEQKTIHRAHAGKRAGVDLKAPKKGTTSEVTRKKAAHTRAARSHH